MKRTVRRAIEKEITTIQITKVTREELKKIGKKGETYDDVIRRLIDSTKEKQSKLKTKEE